MTNLDSIFKNRDITLPTKISLDKAMVFPVVMYGYESWTVGMVARPWSSSRLSCGERLLLRCDGTPGILSRPHRERIAPLELGGGNGAPLDVGGKGIVRG